MRTLPGVFRLVLAVLLLAVCGERGEAAHAAPPQSLFLGDVLCGDDVTECAFPGTVPEHRYLHIVLHDLASNDDWQVEAGPTCYGALALLAGGRPIGPEGFLEVVVDAEASAGPDAMVAEPQCYVFRGRNHWAVHYYTAYFDDTATPDAEAIYPGYTLMAGRPDLPDLDVADVERSPSIPYDAAVNQPARGSTVTFTAHIVNAGGRPLPAFRYSWWLDGRPLRQGRLTASIPAGGTAEISLPWRWDPAPHNLRFAAMVPGPQISRKNDALTVRTNGVTLGMWVERGAYDYFRHRQWLYCAHLGCAGSDSFEDWLQRQVRTWNRLLARSRYPGLAPTGVADRVRVDKITVVPDGSLPLAGGLATNSPDKRDHSVDLEWGVPAADIEKLYAGIWEGPSDVDWSFIHELNHARSMADMYRFDMPVRKDNVLSVTAEDRRPAFNGSQPYSPDNRLRTVASTFNQPFVYLNHEQDLMSCPCTPFYSAYSVLVLNRIRNHRARCGNTNPPCNLGDWFLEQPPLSRIRILDRSGNPLRTGTPVRLFFDSGTSYNGHTFTDANSATLAVSRGEIELGPDPFHARGSAWVAGHNLLLIEVQAPGDDLFCVQEPTDFNLAYWLGYRDARTPATFTLRLGRQIDNDCQLQLPPARVNEPFATSPFRSSALLGNPHGRGEGARRSLTVQLLDDARPAHPMVNRWIAVRSAGKMLAAGLTDGRGRLTLQLRASVSSLSVVDVTDNDLAITRSP